MKANTHVGQNGDGNGQTLGGGSVNPHGRRFSRAERDRALALLAQGKSKTEAAAAVVATAETVRISALAARGDAPPTDSPKQEERARPKL